MWLFCALYVCKVLYEIHSEEFKHLMHMKKLNICSEKDTSWNWEIHLLKDGHPTCEEMSETVVFRSRTR